MQLSLLYSPLFSVIILDVLVALLAALPCEQMEGHVLVAENLEMGKLGE